METSVGPGSPSRGTQARPPRPWVATAIVTALAVLADSPALGTPFVLDDRYVLANASSGSWRDRAFAFDVDRPGPVQGSWWDGISLQRRFVRVLPSLVMSAELATLGQRPAPLHGVTLLFHAASALLLLALLRRTLGHPTGALAGAAFFAVHPIAVEPVAWWCCQPIVIAGTLGLSAALALVHYRRTGARGFLASAWVLNLAAVTSYEAAVAAPALLALLDSALLRRDSASRRDRLVAAAGFAASWIVLGALSAWDRAGVVASETSYRPSAAEAWRVARVDLPNYLLKVFCVFNPRWPRSYGLYNRLGEPLALGIVLAIVVPLVVWALRRRAGRFGLVAFAALLAPPYLVRVFVGAMNVPSLRQVYLPLVGVAVLVAVAVGEISRWRPRAGLALPGLFAIAAIPFDWVLGAEIFGRPRLEEASRATRALLAGVPTARAVAVAGGTPFGCAYSFSFDFPGRREWALVPPASGGAPVLRKLDERAFLAVAHGGFDVPAEEHDLDTSAGSGSRYTVGGLRVRVRPPPLVAAGVQEIEGGARVEVAGRLGDRITALRFRLPEPVDSYVFVDVGSCDRLELVSPTHE